MSIEFQTSKRLKKEKQSIIAETNLTIETNTRSTRSKASKKDVDVINVKPKIIKTEKISKKTLSKKNSVESIYEDACTDSQTDLNQNPQLFNSFVVIEKYNENNKPSTSSSSSSSGKQKMDATYVNQQEKLVDQTHKVNNTAQVQDQTFKIPAQSEQDQTFKIPAHNEQDQTFKIPAHSEQDKTYKIPAQSDQDLTYKIPTQDEQDENHSLLTEDNSRDEVMETHQPAVNKKPNKPNKKKNELFK